MLALPTRSTPHFTHQFPGHILVEVHAETEYQCHACKTDGGGTRFQCNNCEYRMHDYCAVCPGTVSSFMHPQHPLTLAVTPTHRICNLCNEGVEGLFLWCQHCDFNIHPLCTLLPPQLHHVLDQAHPLTLQASVPPGWCAVCRGECHSWRYRCGLCNFDIHMGCVSVPCGQFFGQPNLPAPTQERRIPPYADYGFNYGVDPYAYHCQPPPPVPHHYGANGYGYINPYYNYLHLHQHHPPLPYGHHNGCFCVPPASNNIIQPPQDNYMYNYGNNLQVQGQGSGGGATNNGGYGKKMYGIISQLALGVVSNIIFGSIFS